ncbi:MAG: NAD(P)H-dependent oxidoreductase [Cyclobacteriaceae bacterium]
MKKIIAFGASNNSTSINQQLAKWAASQVEGVEINLLDLNDYEMPIYSMDREKAGDIPEEAVKFRKLVDETDGIIISFAEYNGSYSSAFKNIFDWISRISKPIWADKPMFLMGTSPGGRGARTVLETAVNAFPRQGGNVVASFSLPAFRDNFSGEDGIISEEFRGQFESELAKFSESV